MFFTDCDPMFYFFDGDARVHPFRRCRRLQYFVFCLRSKLASMIFYGRRRLRVFLIGVPAAVSSLANVSYSIFVMRTFSVASLSDLASIVFLIGKKAESWEKQPLPVVCKGGYVRLDFEKIVPPDSYLRIRVSAEEKRVNRRHRQTFRTLPQMSVRSVPPRTQS